MEVPVSVLVLPLDTTPVSRKVGYRNDTANSDKTSYDHFLRLFIKPYYYEDWIYGDAQNRMNGMKNLYERMNSINNIYDQFWSQSLLGQNER